MGKVLGAGGSLSCVEGDPSPCNWELWLESAWRNQATPHPYSLLPDETSEEVDPAGCVARSRGLGLVGHYGLPLVHGSLGLSQKAQELPQSTVTQAVFCSIGKKNLSELAVGPVGVSASVG